MYVFAEPVTDKEMAGIQSLNRDAINQFERSVLGEEISARLDDDQVDDTRWEDMEASVRDTMDRDELGLDESSGDDIARSKQQNHHHVSTSSEDQQGQATDDEGAVSAPEGLDKDSIDPEAGTSDKMTKENYLGPISQSDPQDSEQRDGSRNLSHETDTISSDTGEPSLALDSHSAPDGSPFVNQKHTEQEMRADGPFMKEIDSRQENGGNVLAMTLTLRNKVDGAFVLRPENLDSSNNWSIEYSLVEVTEGDRAWKLYQACRTRRKKKLDAMPEEDADKVSYYIRNLRKMSKQGMHWRRRMDEYQESQPVEVL